jgi:hypothetical protein
MGPIEPLDPALGALLDAERAAHPSGDALDRVWSHVEQSVGTAGATGHAKGSGNAAGHAAWFASHGALVVALAFALGGATGAGATVLLRKPVERLVYVDRPAPPPTAPAVVTMSSTEDIEVPLPSAQPPGGVPAPRRSLVRTVPAAPAPSSLLAERAVLDRARAALAQNDGARAITLTDEHAQRFAHPQLREEREAIAIQALVLEGSYDQARERAKQFRAASPDSLFLPAVDASLASIREANP